jgi:hypothetical protein
MKSGWIGVDLDGTLAETDDERWTKDPTFVGPPVPAMLARVKRWLAEGCNVRIMTARVAVVDYSDGISAAARQRRAIEDWCLEHVGKMLPITATKDYTMVELWDDRAVRVEINTGRRIADTGCEHVCSSCKWDLEPFPS